MKNLSMHIMDIVQNSTRANASLVQIEVVEDKKNDILSIEITDNGTGMDEDTLKKVSDPFFTSRTTRKVGLGIPLLIQNTEQTGGTVTFRSKIGEGTVIKATFCHSHIDRPPWGDIGNTMALIISGNPEVEFVYRHSMGDECFEIDSRIVKQQLDGIPVYRPEVIRFIQEMIEENLIEMGVEM